MTRTSTKREDDTSPFAIDLFVVHPTWAPDAIGAALQLEGHYTQRVGDQRHTPTGRPLDGRYPDTRWRHRALYTTQGQHFAAELSGFIERLTPHRDFFARLRASGGTAQVILNFLGHRYYGDTISPETLRVLLDLGLGLGVEAFVVPQHVRPLSG